MTSIELSPDDTSPNPPTSDEMAAAPTGSTDREQASASLTVAPEALLQRSTPPQVGLLRLLTGTRATTAARSLVLRLADRMSEGRLLIEEPDGTRHQFGTDEAPSELTAKIEVRDPLAWSAVAAEGSIGFGRGFIEGWWHADDPTAVTRILVRNLGPMDDLRNRITASVGPLGDAARKLLPRAGRNRNREDIGAHYDLGNDFFRLFLDDTCTYSSAVFPPRSASNGQSDIDGPILAEASLAKYDRLLGKLGVNADQEVLEIGTGWGGLALRAAEERGAAVTTTTVSARQLDEAKTRAAASPAGDRITLLGRDWRDLEGSFDRVMSIEMIEAVDWRDYDDFFATIERCLKPDGMVGLQAICVPDRRYHRTKNTEDFIRRFVFPGGFLPSIGSITTSVARATRLQVLDVDDFSAHYAETLRRWRARFDHRIADVAALGLDERFQRLWRFYLAYCEAGFLERHCTVNQFVLVGPEWRPTGLDLLP